MHDRLKEQRDLRARQQEKEVVRVVRIANKWRDASVFSSYDRVAEYVAIVQNDSKLSKKCVLLMRAAKYTDWGTLEAYFDNHLHKFTVKPGGQAIFRGKLGFGSSRYSKSTNSVDDELTWVDAMAPASIRFTRCVCRYAVESV
jgi:hypothetical protein